MKIIVTPANVNKLTAALDEIQHRCTARTLTADYIAYILQRAERKLDIPKKYLAGCKIMYSGAERFPNAYHGRPESTHFTAEHNGRHWIVTELHRADCPDREGNTSIILTEAAKAALINRLSCFRL